MTSPQQLFVENDDAAAAWRSVVKGRAFEQGVAMALAQFALSQPSSQELSGALKFINVLTELGDQQKPQERSPFMPRLTPPEQLVPDIHGKQNPETKK